MKEDTRLKHVILGALLLILGTLGSISQGINEERVETVLYSFVLALGVLFLYRGQSLAYATGREDEAHAVVKTLLEAQQRKNQGTKSNPPSDQLAALERAAGTISIPAMTIPESAVATIPETSAPPRVKGGDA